MERPCASLRLAAMSRAGGPSSILGRCRNREWSGSGHPAAAQHATKGGRYYLRDYTKTQSDSVLAVSSAYELGPLIDVLPVPVQVASPWADSGYRK